jgi:beta-glucanase (GH16 family)
MFNNKQAIAFVLLVQAGISQAAAPSPQYIKAWGDDFAGDKVDTKVWNFRTDAKAFSVQKPENVTLSGGEMRINLKPETQGRYKFSAGGLVSKQAFRYGYFETQAQTTSFPGWHAAFWLYAGDGSTTYEFDATSEIDIFEIDSETPRFISKGIIGWKRSWPVADNQHNTGRCNKYAEIAEPAYKAFHTYGAEWTEEGVSYYVDGKLTCSQPYKHSDWPHDKLNIWLTAIGYQKKIGVDPAVDSPIRFKAVSYYVKDYYIHNADQGYAESGGGWSDSEVKGYSEQGARESKLGTASASWTPNILAEGRYEVFAWNVVDATSDPAAVYTVTDSKGHSTHIVDGTDPAKAGWVSLGVHQFGRGTGGNVVVKPSGKQTLRADMVKFVRQ